MTNVWLPRPKLGRRSADACQPFATKEIKEIWPAWTAAWDHQTRFRSSYLVARRYHAEQLAANVPTLMDDQLNQLHPVFWVVADGGEPDEIRLCEISDRVKQIKQFLDDVQKQLPAPD